MGDKSITKARKALVIAKCCLVTGSLPVAADGRYYSSGGSWETNAVTGKNDPR